MSKTLKDQSNTNEAGQKPADNVSENMIGNIAGVFGDVIIQLPNGRSVTAKKGMEFPLDASVITFGSSSVVLKLEGYNSISLGHDENLLLDAKLLALLEKIEEGSFNEAINFERIEQAIEDGEKLDEILPATAAGGEIMGSSSAGTSTRVTLSEQRVTPESGFESHSTESINVESFVDNYEYFNNQPIVLGLYDVAINEDVQVSLNVSSAFTDIDEDQTLRFDVSELPEGLAFDEETGNIVGAATNEAAFTQAGSYRIIVRAQDDSGAPNDTVATSFTLRVNNINDAPTLGGARHIGNIDEDNALTIDGAWFLLEAEDIDHFDELSISDIHLASGSGEIHHNADGTITFVPSENWFGDVSLNYTVSDGNGGYASSVGTVGVASVNDLPVLHADDALITIPNQMVGADVVANDTDVDGDPLSVVVAMATNGSVSINELGELEYTPNIGFYGEDTIEYQVSDGQGGIVDGAVGVSVQYTPGVITINPIGTSSNPTPAISGTASGELVGDVTLEFQGESYTLVVEDDYTWSFTLPEGTVLEDGDYSVAVNGEDTLGINIRAEASFTIDALQPMVSIDDIEQAPAQATFNGSANHHEGDLSLSVNAQTYQVTVDDGGAWSFTLPADAALADGNYEVSVRVQDGQGNSASASDRFLVDDILPTISINDLPVQAEDSPIITGTSSHIDGVITLSVGENIYEVTPNENGSWQLELSELEDGDYTVTAAGEDAQGNSVSDGMTFTVDAIDLIPEIMGDFSASLAEDSADSLEATGDLDAINGDPGESEFIAANINGQYGSFTITNEGEWHYQADNNQAAIQELTQNDSLVETFTVTNSDGVTQASVQITIRGNDDVPTITGNVNASVDEDSADTLLASGSLVIDGGDAGENIFIAGTQQGAVGSFNISENGDWEYQADNAQLAIQSMGANASQTEVFTVRSADGVTTETIAITLNGVNDAPVIDGALAANIEENAGFSLDLLTGASDIDTGDVLAIENLTLVNGNASGVSLSGNTLVVSATSYDGFTENDSETIVYSYDIVDGNGASVAQTATITIEGSNDVPVITGDTTASLVEGAADPLVASGILIAAGGDEGEDQFIAQTIQGDYGEFVAQANGNWTYTADNSQAVIQNLNENSEALVEEFTITNADGVTQQVITITIIGSDDVPTITGTIETTLIEDSADTLVANGTLEITGGDEGENVFIESAQQTALGSFSINANGEWEYEADNAQLAIQSLGANATQTESFTVSSADGITSETIAITLQGVNDTPVVADALNETIGEDDEFNLNLLQGASDIDLGDNLSVDNLVLESGDAGGVSFNGNTLTIPASAYGGLKEGENETIVYSYNIIDGNGGSVAQTATITLQGADDVPEITGDTVATLVEDDSVTLVASGALTAAGGDSGEDLFIAQTVQGNYGEFVSQADGSWMYSADNSQAAIQALSGRDETLTEQFTVTNADGVTQETIDITIVGNSIPDIFIGDTELVDLQSDLETVNFTGGVFDPGYQDDYTDASGVDEANLQLDGETDITLTFVSEAAGLNNALGWYRISEGGLISNANIIWGNVNELSEGEQFNAESVEAGEIGFFLIQGPDDDPSLQLVMDAAAAGEGVLRFEYQGEPAEVGEGSPVLVHYTEGTEENPSGIRTEFLYVLHATHNGLNLDGLTHTDSGFIDGDTSTLYVGFEDLIAWDSTNPNAFVDWDLRDLVFTVEMDRVVEYRSPISAEVNIVDDSATLNSATVQLSLGRTGDQLELTEAGGALAAQYGISVSVDALSRSISLNGSASHEAYEEVLSSLSLASSSPLGDARREISLRTSDEDGNESFASVITLNAGNPADEASNFIAGTSADDSLEGLLGDDIIFGSTGSDTVSGGEGRDTFLWMASDADGSTDTVLDFQQGSDGDVLDFTALLQGESEDTATLDAYFDFASEDGVSTTISIDAEGDASGADLELVIANVDLTLIGDDQAILQSLIDQGNLLVDA